MITARTYRPMNNGHVAREARLPGSRAFANRNSPGRMQFRRQRLWVPGAAIKNAMPLGLTCRQGHLFRQVQGKKLGL